MGVSCPLSYRRNRHAYFGALDNETRCFSRPSQGDSSNVIVRVWAVVVAVRSETCACRSISSFALLDVMSFAVIRHWLTKRTTTKRHLDAEATRHKITVITLFCSRLYLYPERWWLTCFFLLPVNSKTLYDLHNEFLDELVRATSPHNTVTIPDCFIKFKHRFIIYGDYCANLPAAQKLVEDLRSSSPVLHQHITVCLSLSIGWKKVGSNCTVVNCLPHFVLRINVPG